MNRPLALLFAFAVSTGLLACSSDDDAAANGAAPKIAGLTFDKTTIKVGTQETITATMTFEDADGDLDGVQGQIKAGGQTIALAKTPARNAGEKAGTLTIAAAILAPSAGTAEVELWAVDVKGNESNRLSTTIEAK